MFTKEARMAVVGLGISGISIAKCLAKQGFDFSLHDSRSDLKISPELQALAVNRALYLGPFQPEHFAGCTHLFISPGLDPNTPFFNDLKKKGIVFGNDISLFACLTQKPIIGVTGSNGKSTVTTLTGLMLEAAGMRVGVGGNLGTPALDLLDDENEAYVLELSSFQLEIADHLPLKTATILNLSPDHLDRHGSLEGYHAAKHTIFNAADIAVINQHDAWSAPLSMGSYHNPLIKSASAPATHLFFGLNAPQNASEFGIALHQEKPWLCAGQDPVIAVSDLKICGQHNQLNALAAMALASTVNVPIAAMRAVLASFEGLPHRAQSFLLKNHTTWINDSKGTNTGATLATFAGLLPQCAGKMILILGGRGKGEDYAILQTVAAQCRAVLLLGEEADAIEAAILKADVPKVRCHDLKEVVVHAKAYAQQGDFVLFSPACTSFDMFENYKARGEAFMECVKQNA